MSLRTVWGVALGAAIAFLLNATLRFARVEVTEEEVTVTLGPLGFARIPRQLVMAARRVPWRWYYGYGIRLYGPQAAGFVGRPGPVVELVFSEPVTIRAAIPMQVNRLAVVVENPEELLATLERPAEGAA